jgi:hypothetical protein
MVSKCKKISMRKVTAQLCFRTARNAVNVHRYVQASATLPSFVACNKQDFPCKVCFILRVSC